MSEPIKCYAVSSGEYSDYQVHAIYRRREDAEERVEKNNYAPLWLVDGKPFAGSQNDLPMVDRQKSYGRGIYFVLDTDRVKSNPGREDVDDMRVEEFDYYEGEPLPAAQEMR